MERKPVSEDLHIGRRLRQRRQELKLSQKDLATKLNMTFQQVAKYEAGKNRISAGTLYFIARVLDTPVCWFFEGLGSGDKTSHAIASKAGLDHGNDLQPLSARRAAELNQFMKLASRISDPEHRKILLGIMTTMGKT